MRPDRLPIEAALPALLSALRGEGRAVLVAPPGAGKTTRVPLALLDEVAGRIVMLEPRRLAARAAAERMAESLGERVGERVGYRIRGEARVGRETRIEVVTEGILTRMLQSDPGLDGIGCVIFDEFHERSLNADLGLALGWEARGALRPDLRLVVMSATLDAEPVAMMLDGAPVIRAEGRAYPVETRWLARPRPPGMRFEAAAAGLIAEAVAETAGGVLAFLPGEGEIRRVAGLLQGRLPADVTLHPLYGAMDLAAQRAAIGPSAGRKLVLATSIAETSLTIEDVRVVVDTGRARRARFDPASGMARLVTERVSRAEAEQRRGRAGRVAPGICYRMWARGEEGALPAFAPPEMAVADLAGLALELALWGAGPEALAFLTPPPAPALAEARALLVALGALERRSGRDDAGEGPGLAVVSAVPSEADALNVSSPDTAARNAPGAAGRTAGAAEAPSFRITAHGKRLAGLPLHPRLAHMLVLAGADAAPLAALLAERDPLRGAPADLALRLAALRDPKAFAADHPWVPDRGVLERVRAEAKRLARLAPDGTIACSPAEMAALAYPDRIGQHRPGEAPRFLLSNGKGAVVDAADALGAMPLIVATDLDGDLREARVRQGIALPDASLRRLFADDIRWHEACVWSRRDGRVQARRQEMFGALVLDDRPWTDAPEAAVAQAALDGLRQIGLPWSEPARRFRARVEFLRHEAEDLPDFGEAALLDRAGDWLLPHLGRRRSEAELRAMDILPALRGALDWEAMQRLDRLAPADFVTPLCRRLPIDYEGEAPGITLRLQELFGVTAHPVVGPKRLPLRITLLSPGGRPVQVTMDLPGFWASSYADVRKEMRGRYPRHPWPEDPCAAAPTLRARPRA